VQGGSAVGREATCAVVSGAVGGAASVAQGGSFKSGFLAGGFASVAGSVGGGVLPSGETTGGYAANVAFGSVAGGVGSVIGGGKFANGAITGAFGYLFNEAADALARRRYQSVIDHGNIDFDANMKEAAEWGRNGDLKSFVDAVKPGGDWDFKSLDAFKTFQDKNLLQEFGNFHFGSAAHAFGFTLGTSIAGAGTVQTLVQGHSDSARLGRRLNFGVSALLGQTTLVGPLFFLNDSAAAFAGRNGMHFGDYADDIGPIISGYEAYGK